MKSKRRKETFLGELRVWRGKHIEKTPTEYLFFGESWRELRKWAKQQRKLLEAQGIRLKRVREKGLLERRIMTFRGPRVEMVLSGARGKAGRLFLGIIKVLGKIR